MQKIAIVGAGNVGATVAEKLADRELCEELALVDVIEGLPEGKALDMWESAPIEAFDIRVHGSTDFGLMKGSDLVVVTAGLPRKPGMTRSDLLDKNAAIIRDVAGKIRQFSPDAIVIVVTNPLDVMAYLAYRILGFPKARVIGMAGVLDTARYRTFIAAELGVSVEDVSALVLGGHGDSMVPLRSCASVSGIPLTTMLSAERIAALTQRTRDGGAEVVNLLKAGSAFYAPAAAIAEMVDSIARNKRRLVPCSVLLEGEYGLRDVFLGVPVILGSGGVERIVELPLEPEEREALHRSGAAVATDIAQLKL